MITKNINDLQIKTGDGWLVSVRYTPYSDEVKIWLAKQEIDGISICHFDDKGQITVTKLVEGEQPEPTMRVNRDIWEGIKQAINGVEETPDKKAVDSELMATKYHLEDMRKLLKLK